jgi:membrane protease YdiL (CAAX protease family)
LRAFPPMPVIDPLLASFFLPASRSWQLWLYYGGISWLLVWGTHLLFRALDPRYAVRPWPWHRLVGLVLVLFPFIRITYGFLLSIPDVVTTGTTAVARPPEYWWRVVRQNMVINFFVPLVGLFLAIPLAERHRLQAAGWGGSMRHVLARVGMWPKRSWAHDLATGFGLAVLVFFGYVGLHYVLAPLQDLDTGDASQVFTLITLPLAFALAIMAGVTEEFLYRGILVVRAARLLPDLPRAAIVVVAAVLFGLAHAGYGTVANMLFPFLFGLLMGVIALKLGVWPAVIVHAFVNLMIFLANLLARSAPGAGYAMTVVFSFAVAYPLAYFIVRALTRRGKTRRTAVAPPGTARPGDPSPPIAVTRSGGRNS